METLLVTLALWLSANFDLPANLEPPRIEFAAPTTITALRYGALVNQRMQTTIQPSGSRGKDVVSVYEDATRTIYLPTGWSGQTPAELSILVHEMVHHLQNVGKFKFACPQERERVAYSAQDQWLRMFGRNLESDFELDPFTLLVKSNCGY
jgi:hypothetical protein